MAVAEETDFKTSRGLPSGPMVAITGAGGFIGFQLAKRLKDRGLDLLLVDHSPKPGRTKNPAGTLSPFCASDEEFPGILNDPSIRIQAVFHLGATIATESLTAEKLVANNVDYSRQLWEACARRRVPFFYASSAATYGDGSMGFDDETGSSDLKPLNPYAQSKNAFDQWVMETVSQGKPKPHRWAGFKFFNVYGPGERHKGPLASMVWQCYRQIRENGTVRLFASPDPDQADGSQSRDFVFVGDCIDHLLWFFDHEIPDGIYNSGTGEARTFLELAKAVFRAMNLPERIEFIPFPESLKNQYQAKTCAVMRKLARTGYTKALTPLESGIAQTIRGYQEESDSPGSERTPV